MFSWSLFPSTTLLLLHLFTYSAHEAGFSSSTHSYPSLIEETAPLPFG